LKSILDIIGYGSGLNLGIWDMTETTQPELSRHNFHVEGFRMPSFLARKSKLIDPPVEAGHWQGDLLELFLRNQMNLAPIMPILTLLMGLTALNWVAMPVVMAWLVGAMGCHSLQLYLCNRYFLQQRSREEQSDWIGMISASELFQGAFWVIPLFYFWPETASLQQTFLLSAIIAVIVVRLLVVANFMPVLIAGTGIMTIGVALRCVAEGHLIYFALAGLVVTLEVFFLFVSRQLQDTARDRLIFRAQKDVLIEELRIEKVRAEEERRKAEDANRAKSAFLANMSHELRTPLNAILGFSEVLESELFGPMQNNTYKDYAGDINSSGRYLLALINDILDLSRIEAGRRDISEQPTQVAECLDYAKAMLVARAIDKNIAVSINTPANLPKLLCDYRAVNQIAINLLNNAIKFTPNDGRVQLTARVLPDGRMAVIISDNGPGIPKTEQENLMKAFSRGAHATKLAIEGAGLGLPIVKGLTEAHGGTMEISSEPGKGTDIICNFPASRVLSGPRGEAIASAAVRTETQRKLIAITG
jgi:two-component system, cell cycle sensor histidine kinase PleC